MKVLRTFLPALLLSAPMVASAQYDRADETEAVLEEVVVEASRARLTVNDIAVNTSVLGTEDVLESAYKPADEILRQMARCALKCRVHAPGLEERTDSSRSLPGRWIKAPTCTLCDVHFKG